MNSMNENISVEVLHEVVYSFIDEKIGRVTVTQRVTQEQLAALLASNDIALISVDNPPKAYSFKKRRKR